MKFRWSVIEQRQNRVICFMSFQPLFLCFKYAFDKVMAGAVILLLMPVILILACVIKKRLGSPILFRQVRPGLHGKTFEILKFRTMREAVDGSGNLLPDEVRLSAFGVKLRNSSLDELPGLWNVLKGDMSLVGPRPLLPEYLPLYSKEQARRHDVRPGITGWAQVNGRNAISWNEKFKLDVWYVDNQSFLLDFKILFLTVKKVLNKDGISADGEATVECFKGNKIND